MEAAKLMMDKLGSNYTVTIYHLQDGLKKSVKVDNPKEFGVFFDEEVYCVDINSQQHRYMIIWHGPVPAGGDSAKISETLNKLEDGGVSSNTSRINVRQCQEPEDFLQFFKNGFIILRGKRTDLPAANDAIKQGALFRVQAPYGNGARAIQQAELASNKLNGH